MLAAFGCIIWLTLNFLTAVMLARRNAYYAILPNMSLIVFSIIYIIPIVFSINLSVELIISIIISNIVIVLLFIIFSFNENNKRVIIKQLYRNKYIYISNFSLVIAIAFCLIGNFATYFSLINSNGLFTVISDFGGRGYLSVRVNNEGSGILGVIAWLSPFSIAFIYAAALTKYRIYYWLLFISLFILTAIGYGLLTVRHNMLATLIMLMLTHIIYRKISLKVIIISIAAGISVLIYFQSLRISGLEGLNFTTAFDRAFISNEHLQVSQHVIEVTDSGDFVYFRHALDIFTFAVPRALWPSKPETSTLNRIFFPGAAAVGSEKAIGLVAEGYASLGYLGVIILSVAFSLVIVMLQGNLNRMSVYSKSAFLAIALVPICYIGIRTGLLGKHLISFIVIYFQYLILISASKFDLNLRATGWKLSATKRKKETI